jgi:hypothetical protein
MKLRTQAMAVALASALAASALAQPVEHRARNGVNWLSGGVSEDERDAMRDAAPGFNLQVVVAMSGSGEYRADVPVTVENLNGEPVLNVVTDGPWLFANVPPGRYRVRTGDGQERFVDVATTGRSVVYFHSTRE